MIGPAFTGLSMCDETRIRWTSQVARLRRHASVSLCMFALLCGCDQSTPQPAADGSASIPDSTTGTVPVSRHFSDEASQRGLTAQLLPGNTTDYAMSRIMGGGIALLDFDLDGDIDIALAHSADPTAKQQLPSPGFLLFEQSDAGHFRNAASRIHSPELPETDIAAGFAVGDVNNDGRPDVYLTVHGEDRLFLNDATAGLTNITDETGLTNLKWGTSACFFDFDRDGWLDLFVTNYVDDTPQECRQLSGASRDFCSPSRFAGTIDRLFRNVTGDSPGQKVRFEDVTFKSGIGDVRSKGLGAVAADLTGDGWPDIYVANDQEQNSLWVNQRDGTFKDEALIRGCALDALGNAQASMGIIVHDFDHDGRFDLFVTHLSGERNTLYHALPDGTFTDISARVPACNASLPLTGFGAAVCDVDSDGHDEIIVANGLVRRPDGVDIDLTDFWQPYRQPNVIFTGSQESELLVPARQPATSLSLLTGSLAVSRGLAAGDLDGDGDCDLVVTSLDAPTRLLINQSEEAVSRLRIRPALPQFGGRSALGAVVSVGSGQQHRHCLVHRAGSYLTSQLPVASFIENPDQCFSEALITWPEGQRESFQLDEISDRNSIIVLEQGSGLTVSDD